MDWNPGDCKTNWLKPATESEGRDQQLTTLGALGGNTLGLGRFGTAIRLSSAVGLRGCLGLIASPSLGGCLSFVAGTGLGGCLGFVATGRLGFDCVMRMRFACHQTEGHGQHRDRDNDRFHRIVIGLPRET